MQNDNTKREHLEEKVKKELRPWIKEQHPSWLVYPCSVGPGTLSKGHPYQAYHLSPDIDVLAFSAIENALIGYEVKAPIYRDRNYDLLRDEKENISWQRYPNSSIRKPERGVKVDKKKFKTEPDLKIIYTGIGEAFFNLRYVDLSFIVLPTLKDFCPDYQHPIFIDLLLKRFLPLGLIEFKYPSVPSSDPAAKISVNKLTFKESYKAESSLIWKDYNTYMGYREDNFVWEERGGEFKKGDAVGISGPVGTFRDQLIKAIEENHIS